MGVLVLLAMTAGAGCKKRGSLADDPSEKGKLTRISAHLEEAYAKTQLPGLTEPASLSDRLDKWDDFRSCTVRTYVARKRDADQRAREGKPRPSRHASIGDEAVEECAVEMAVVEKEPKMCERLALDYAGPGGEQPLSAVRCWDTRARVLGLPEECPVVWMFDDVAMRNPECLAMARRDISLCRFADSPGRCRVLMTSDPAGCGQPDAAPDCHVALDYWRGLIPLGTGQPVVPPPREGEPPLSVTFDLAWEKGTQPRMRIDGPKSAAGVSWPTGKTRPAWTEDTTKVWGGRLPDEMVQVGWRAGAPWLKLGFSPAGALSGTRKLQPPGPTASATVIAVWTDDPNKFRRCAPGPDTTGEVQFDATGAQPGAIVTGKAQARRLACTDGSELNLDATFRLVIIDVR